MPTINTKHCNKHGVYKGSKCPMCRSEYEKQYSLNKRNKKNQEIYQSAKWRAIRRKVLIRDSFTCQGCGDLVGIKPRDHVVDHIVEIDNGGAEYDMENLETLCQSCHNKKKE